MNKAARIKELAEEFQDCREILCALGDDNRQHILLTMMEMGRCEGVRVNRLTEKTHLSRPAVSHHLQILKHAGILKVRREGTRNYYYFDPEMAGLNRILSVLSKAVDIASQ